MVNKIEELMEKQGEWGGYQIMEPLCSCKLTQARPLLCLLAEVADVTSGIRVTVEVPGILGQSSGRGLASWLNKIKVLDASGWMPC